MRTNYRRRRPPLCLPLCPFPLYFNGWLNKKDYLKNTRLRRFRKTCHPSAVLLGHSRAKYFVACVTDEKRPWLSPSAKQRRTPGSGILLASNADALRGSSRVRNARRTFIRSWCSWPRWSLMTTWPETNWPREEKWGLRTRQISKHYNLTKTVYPSVPRRENSLLVPISRIRLENSINIILLFSKNFFLVKISKYIIFIVHHIVDIWHCSEFPLLFPWSETWFKLSLIRDSWFPIPTLFLRSWKRFWN